jgi:phenylpropionate dioxygenase-like ring-hydroxylating dioxygenase large terminal subunit
MSSNSQRTGPGNPSGLRPLAEGEDGLFSQSWFPICLSEEVPAGQVKGFDFLGGRIVVMRGADGTARVMSAYCPHLGADLAVGTVVENTVRCAFHQWEYNAQGQCVRTGCGDPPPARARLFAFPTAEHFGVVFAFNGDKPLFDLPAFEYPAEQLLWRSLRFDMDFPVDPWVISCNTPDLQHIRVVHRISFDTDPANAVEWTDHSMQYEFSGQHAAGEPLQFRVGIHGTNIYQQSGPLNGRWFGFLSPMGLPRPQTTTGFLTLAVLRDQPDAEEFLESVIELERRVVGEDESILKTIRFRPGTLTASDRTLSRFLRYLKEYPRAHPSRDYIT